MRPFLLLAAFAISLTACSSQQPAPERSASGVESRNPNAVSAPIAKSDFDPMSIAALKDPRSPLSKRSVYFDYDSYLIKNEFRALLTAHGKFLVANHKMKVLIQGNADERGSHEYNLALGQKRSDAVKKALLLIGVRDEQMESVSLGEEKSLCVEQTETCWAQNRRADILYSGEF